MLTVIRPWRLKSSGAHCARTFAVEVQRCSLRLDLAKRIDETLGEADWRDRLARHLAKRIGEEVQEGEVEEEEEEEEQEE